METYTDPQQAMDRVSSVIGKIIDSMFDSSSDIADFHVKSLRREAVSKGLVGTDSPHMIDTIRHDHANEGMDNVEIAQKGLWIDSMNPHFVKLQIPRKIALWAQQKGNLGVKTALAMEDSIMVHPHPFIRDATNNTITQVPIILKRNIEEAIQ